MNKKITENDLYAKLRKEREELYKIIGKEGITDQKVRIDKYAHLYVLQDEMTEYLRARRLSQAEIEKLYAVENFYEYMHTFSTKIERSMRRSLKVPSMQILICVVSKHLPSQRPP